jgi:hypothetical protein
LFAANVGTIQIKLWGFNKCAWALKVYVEFKKNSLQGLKNCSRDSINVLTTQIKRRGFKNIYEP